MNPSNEGTEAPRAATREGYDLTRVALFRRLIVELLRHDFEVLPEQNTTPRSFANFAFLEAYFSNNVIGTELDLDDAMDIIEAERSIPTASGDSHDMLGTHRLVSSREEMSITPRTAEEFLALLVRRHEVLLSARDPRHAGRFKTQHNRAGDVRFVHPAFVRGTLTAGFQLLGELEQPFARAAFVMFLVGEVHPFADGNGRLGRVMMNAELVSSGQARIIVPTRLRDAYVTSLRCLTSRGEPKRYVEIMREAHAISAAVVGEDLFEMLARCS